MALDASLVICRDPQGLAVAPFDVDRAPLQRQHLAAQPERVDPGNRLLGMLVTYLDLAHIGALDVAIDARAGPRAGLPVEEFVQALTCAPLAGPSDLQIVAQLQFAQDHLKIVGRQHAVKETRQLDQAHCGSSALLEQAENLLDGDARTERGARREGGHGGLKMRVYRGGYGGPAVQVCVASRWSVIIEQCREEQPLEWRAIEADHAQSAAAPVAPPDPLDERIPAAGRPY